MVTAPLTDDIPTVLYILLLLCVTTKTCPVKAEASRTAPLLGRKDLTDYISKSGLSLLVQDVFNRHLQKFTSQNTGDNYFFYIFQANLDTKNVPQPGTPMCVSLVSLACHTHFYSLYVSEIITLKVANLPDMMNFITYTYFKINLLPNSILLQCTRLFISPSRISELGCATTKTDTAERSISIGRESLQVFFFFFGTRGLGVLPGSTARG